MKWKVCHWLDPSGNTQVIHLFVLVKTDFSVWILNNFCFPNLRGSWTTNCKTKTMLCLFLLFMEDRKWIKEGKHFLGISVTAVSWLPLHSSLLLSLYVPTTRHPIGHCGCVSLHRDIWGDWCSSAGMSGNSEMVTKKNAESLDRNSVDVNNSNFFNQSRQVGAPYEAPVVQVNPLVQV